MLRVEAGTTSRYCDGMSRRSFVQIGVAGMASVPLSDVLRAKALSHGEAKDTSVILLWLDGGPGHMDLYDMKPEAPAEYRGIWRPLKTNVPGIEISPLFPRQAKIAETFSIVRSLHHGHGGHFQAAHLMLTTRQMTSGGREASYPSVGAIATKVCGSRDPLMPPYVSVPYASSIGRRPGYFAGNYLGRQYDPFETNGDPNKDNFKVQDVVPQAGLTIDRLGDRRTLVEHLDRLRKSMDHKEAFETFDHFQRSSYELITGKAAQAFDLSSEDPRVRDRYGRNGWGQSTLLARRLSEAGVTFVTCHYGGWDHHWNLEGGMNGHLPKVDMAVSSLLTDLRDRGLYDRTLVVLCGEFSRTPRMNTGHNGKGTPGRDHWGNSMFCLLAGGGVQGGRIVGSTDAKGERPKDRPVTPGDLHATIYRVLGVDPYQNFLDRSGRPIPAVDSGAAIHELF